MRFEYFLSLLKNSNMVIGNSSVGIREAFYGVPTINVGSRQLNRVKVKSIHNIDFNIKKLSSKIKSLDGKDIKKILFLERRLQKKY